MKNIQLFQRRHMSWRLMFFFSGRKNDQYADQELLKSLFQNKTPDLRLKYIDPKGKILLKKETKQKKKWYKKTENSVSGSRTRFICTFKQLLDHCTTVTHMIWQINFVISKQFFSVIDAVWSWWSCIYHEFKYTFEENSQLKRVFQSYFALFRVQRVDSM